MQVVPEGQWECPVCEEEDESSEGSDDPFEDRPKRKKRKKTANTRGKGWSGPLRNLQQRVELARAQNLVSERDISPVPRVLPCDMYSCVLSLLESVTLPQVRHGWFDLVVFEAKTGCSCPSLLLQLLHTLALPAHRFC